MKVSIKQKAVEVAKYLKNNGGSYEIEVKEGGERNNLLNFLSVIGCYDNMRFTSRKVDDGRVIIFRMS